MVMQTDLLILGGGPGGYVAAIYAAKQGLDVVLVEKEKVGGTCLHRGCIPTKALLQSAAVLEMTKRNDMYGVTGTSGTPDIDFAKVQGRKDKIVSQLHMGVEGLLKKNKVKLIKGTGAILGPSIFSPVSGTVAVTFDDDREEVMILPKKLLIATGSSPKTLPHLPIDEKDILSSNGMLLLEKLPRSIAIVGGGVIGVEWASLLNSFGVEVTIIEALDRLVALESVSISKELKKQFEKRGIKVLLKTKVEKVEGSQGDMSVFMEEQAQPLKVEKVMVAIGRKPNIDNIGLQNTSVKYTPRGITVNEYYQTTESHIYAIGDAIDTIQLAHVASKEGELAVDHILGHPVEPLNYTNIPRCTYTHPEIASAGLVLGKPSEVKDLSTGHFNFASNGKAMILGETEGFVEVYRDSQTDDIVGISMIGPHATDMIAEASLALYLNASGTELAHCVHPHPTISEVVQEAAFDAIGLAIHK